MTRSSAICYAYGLEIFGWNKSTDNPLNKHSKQKHDCIYVVMKKSYKHELTAEECLEIEKYKYNDMLFETR